MSLLLRSSQIHSVGCYTTSGIPSGSKIVEYSGRKITAEQGDALYEGLEITYLFGLEDGRHVIDGNGMAAFINHSCDPNCETDEIDGHIWIISARDIAAGEELTYDYNLYDGEAPEEAPCFCGSRHCRGSMFAPEEIKRLKKVSRKPQTIMAQGVAP